jgi:hypothetical protein
MIRLLLLAGAVGLSSPALAGGACTIGQPNWCSNHMVYRCDNCGGQTCAIFTGQSCYKSDPPDQHVENASRFDVAQTASAPPSTSTTTPNVPFTPRDRVIGVTGGLPPAPPTPPSAPQPGVPAAPAPQVRH